MKLAPLIFIFLVAAVINLSDGHYEAKVSKKVMVCYFGSWSVYRWGDGLFDVEDIDPFLCTHIIFAFAQLGENNTIEAYDAYNDLEDNWGKGAYVRFTGLKNQNPELKALLAIGGWNEGSEKYSKMASDSTERAKFVASVVPFLQKYNFDGLDMDWEYPSNRGGAPEDKVNFITLLNELKTAFNPHGLMLTAAVAAGKGTIDTAYNIPAMASVLDQLHLMAYDYHGAWDPYTGHHSPLYNNPAIDLGNNSWYSQDFSLNYYISNGAPANKIVLGMPTYGRGFTLQDPANNGLYATAYQPIPAGPYTGEAGFWAYYEICGKLSAESGWNIVRDAYYQAPYAYRGDHWIGYDDEESIRNKARYVASKNLLGAMAWSVDTDDFRGNCHGKPFPLTTAIVETLNGPIVYPSTTRPAASTTSPGGQTTTTARATTKQTGTAATTTRPSGEFTCQAAGFFPDPNDCGWYYECVSNGNGWTEYHLKCGEGTVFDPTSNTCNFPSAVPDCENYVPNPKSQEDNSRA